MEQVYRALADKTRRAILDELSRGESAATRLRSGAHLAQPTVSKHLKILREAGLVSRHQRGRERIYRLEAARLAQVHAWVGRYEKFWSERLDVLGDLLDEVGDE